MRRLTRNLLQKTGIYPLARSIYRSLHPQHRRERKFNRRFYEQLIRPGDLCFDIGANVGQTIEAFLSASARVIAVEPNPRCANVLAYQFGGHPDVTLLQVGVAAAAGHADLHFHGTESTASMREDWPFQNDETTRVPVTTLDALMAEHGRPRFLKVDVEGFELEVFKGLTSAVPVIYFEAHRHESERAVAILQHLASVGSIEAVHAAAGDNSRWLLEDWLPHSRFLERLSGLPEHSNVVVKMRVA